MLARTYLQYQEISNGIDREAKAVSSSNQAVEAAPNPTPKNRAGRNEETRIDEAAYTGKT
jgi:hypothetical protein